MAYMDQTSYYQGGSTLNVNDPRFLYVTRSTNNGGAWSAAKKLPGQTNTSRGDYINIAASGSNVYVVTTNTQNGQTWFWRSTDRGKSLLLADALSRRQGHQHDRPTANVRPHHQLLAPQRCAPPP